MSKYQLPKPGNDFSWVMTGLIDGVYARVMLSGSGLSFIIAPGDSPRKVYRNALRVIEEARGTIGLLDRVRTMVKEANGD